MKLLAIIAGLLLLACNAFGQSVNCNGATGHVVLGSGPAYVDCGSTPAPPAPVPPPTPTPVPPGQCSPAQTSYTGLARFCNGGVYWPTKPSNNYNGTLADLFTVFHGSWTNKAPYSGQPFTINVPDGQYVSFAFAATDALRSLQFAYNQTSGQNGHAWLSSTPGGPPRGTSYEDCSANANANLLIYPIPGYACSIFVGQTVFINFSPSPGDSRPISYGAY